VAKRLVTFPKEDIEFAQSRKREQESIYGRDSGYFKLGTGKENTLTGVLGELAVRRLLLEDFDLDPEDVVLNPPGHEFDISVSRPISGQLHVKAGLWQSWPADATAFGVHAGQNLEESDASLVLVSMLKPREGDAPAKARVEGFMTPSELAESPIIEKGQLFPGMRYPSRTDNPQRHWSMTGGASVFIRQEG